MKAAMILLTAALATLITAVHGEEHGAGAPAATTGETMRAGNGSQRTGNLGGQSSTGSNARDEANTKGARGSFGVTTSGATGATSDQGK